MDSSKKTYKSHIQLSKVLLRPYQEKNTNDDTYYVNLLNLQDYTYQRKKLNEIDCDKGEYFNQAVEDFLAKEIESKINTEIDKAREAIDSSQNHSNRFTMTDIKFFRSLFKYYYIRNVDFYNIFLEKSITSRILPNITHSNLFGFDKSIDKFFADKKIGFIINKTSIGFVCPHNVIYYVFSEIQNTFFLVITLKKELAIFIDISQSSNNIDVIEIYESENVYMLNLAAYYTEKNHTNPYIVGRKVELERLLFDIQNKPTQSGFIKVNV